MPSPSRRTRNISQDIAIILFSWPVFLLLNGGPKPLAAIPIAAQQELNHPTGRRLPALYHGKIHQLSAASAKFRSASKTLTCATNISTRPYPETIFFRG